MTPSGTGRAERSQAVEYFPHDPPAPGRANSPVVRAGDFVFISGQVAMTPQGDIIEGGVAAQTCLVMQTLGALLARAGASFSDVCKVTVWLADIRDSKDFNEVYLRYFSGGLPARSLVQARFARNAKVEIELVAYRPAG